jgi:hypothetical protein
LYVKIFIYLLQIKSLTKYPIHLNLEPYMTSGDGSNVYELYGVIVHQSPLNSTEYGHYYCYVNCYDRSWRKFDDQEVLSCLLLPYLCMDLTLASNIHALIDNLSHGFPSIPFAGVNCEHPRSSCPRGIYSFL